MKTLLKTLIASSTAALVLVAISPAYADDARPRAGARAGIASTTIEARKDAAIETRISKAKARAHEEIERRIKQMQELSTRIQGMARVSAESKASIAATLQTQITSLTALDAKIAADTDIMTIKTDIKSITGDYRIFALVMPQGRIMAAADRFKTIAANLSAMADKLSTRITEAQTAGKDVTELSASLTDMRAKIADAQTQADAAIALVAGLTPDNGDKTKQDANKKALDDARAKLKTAHEDVKAARKDAGAIVKGLKGMGLGKSATTTPDND